MNGKGNSKPGKGSSGSQAKPLKSTGEAGKKLSLFRKGKSKAPADQKEKQSQNAPAAKPAVSSPKILNAKRGSGKSQTPGNEPPLKPLPTISHPDSKNSASRGGSTPWFADRDFQKLPLARLLRLASRFSRYAWDTAGILSLSLAVMTVLALALPDLAGGVLLEWWSGILRTWFGWGSAWAALLIGVIGLWMLWQPISPGLPKIRWGRIFALEAAFFVSLALLAVIAGNQFGRAEAGLDGGRIGWGLAEILSLVFSPLPFANLIQIGLLTVILLPCMAFGLGLDRMASGLANLLMPQSANQASSEAYASGPAVSEAPLSNGQESALAVEARKKRAVLPPEFRQNLPPPPEPVEAEVLEPQERDARLPHLDLLINEQAFRPDERHINMTAGMIIKTLAEFGIPAKVTGYRIGPTVTQFAVEPGFVEKQGSEGEVARFKVRVAQISSLQRDLALALAANRLRIEAPVPGRPYVGIEVPNSRSSLVRLRPILESEGFHKVGSSLAIGLGRDVSGQPVSADLGRMPHLLVAGTTGSGKSICIAAITTCLVMNNTPDNLRLVMIDPKMVELMRFNGLPHLLGKVETDLERILAVLRWTVAEMERRYKLLEIARSRNIDTYNRKIRRRPGEAPLPHLVVLIDELADLMMSAPDQTEHTLVRLAQMARATGIHLVVATQRPSTDVVTGLIKANFPARIAFAVASSIDSRVILDTTGAETLLGRGDMLFLPPEASAPVRCQGAMVSDGEIERVIAFWQKTLPSKGEPSQAPWDELIAQEAFLADRDGLVDQAAQVVRETQRASASMLQRRLKIGYPRAAHLIDELEELGVVGPSQGGGREREVLIGPEDELPTRPAVSDRLEDDDE